MHISIPPYDDDPEKRGFAYIRIDDYDVWSMDTTLSRIIVPMLKILRHSKQGIPANLVPAPYSSGDQFTFEFIDDDMAMLDQSHNKGQERWDEILDKMIWSFDEIQNGNWGSGGHIDFKKPNASVLYTAYMARVQEGIDLFAKYYGNLWD